MQLTIEDTLTRLEQKFRDEFRDVKMEFSKQIFANHAELWIYVLDLSKYEDVRKRSDSLTEEEGLDRQTPEIWLLPKPWTGPWPSGESEQKIRERREEFKRQHAAA
ncbi:MAG: hypothetical protein JWL77_4297 [Chthonomonadaceae bacterium]|nr:hypothetical protein [Chthonomonadaceae bacterium]